MEALSIALLTARMRSDQWKGGPEIEELQERKLLEQVSYAKKNVPHFSKALKGKEIRGLEDLASLPILTKGQVRANCESLISSQFGMDTLVKMQTSGSTGTPLDIYHSKSESRFGPAFELRQFIESGLGPFDKLVHIIYHTGKPRLLQSLGIYRREYLSMHDDEGANLSALIRKTPSALFCHPSYALPMAHLNQAEGKGVKIGKIFSYAEMLSPGARALLKQSFGSEVYDMYGSMETSWISWQCEMGGMHLHSDHLIAEIVDGDGEHVRDGEYGEILVTPLWQRAMPLIRYRLGDRAAFGPKCRCGRGLRTLKGIEGRDDDFIVLGSGRPVSGRFVGVYARAIPGLLLFQAVQERAGELRIDIVTRDGRLPDSSVKRLVRDLNAFFPEPVKITVRLVDRIKRSPSGKLQSVVSKVRPGF